MQIALLHCPPWKIPASGEIFPPEEGPPKSFDSISIQDADFCTIPYGLLSLAAQAKRAGHQVTLANLCNWTWQKVTAWVGKHEAQLFGISCLTANRRGVISLASYIRQVYPQAHICIGGPHATALAKEMLERCKAIDTVVVGEGELTFMELLERLQAKKHIGGLSGALSRCDGQIITGPSRNRIDDLDQLASPHDCYSSHIMLTSRGCPGQCTFCDSETMWQRKLRFHSTAYVLDMLEKAVQVNGHKFLSIKDDTFTANPQRAMEICQGISAKKLNFVWSCDTRVDALNEEVLRAMRIAGCRMLSLGVESGSLEILSNIKKRISPDQILQVTELAKTFGFQIRYYMMWGNRGETRESIQESLKLIETAKPHQLIFTLLSVYPGTKEFELLQEQNVFTKDIFFTSDFVTLKCFLGDSRQFGAIKQLLEKYEKRRGYNTYTEAESYQALQNLPSSPEAHLDYAAACCRCGKLELAEKHARIALETNYALPGLALNCLGCAAAAQGNFEKAKALFAAALQNYPHAAAMANARTLDAWLSQGAAASGRRMLLEPDTSFETIWLESQPEKPVTA